MNDLLMSLGMDVTDFSTGKKVAKEQADDLKKSFKAWGDIFAAGGILTGVVGFFSAVIERAKNTKGAVDDNTAAVQRLSQTLESGKSTVMDWGTQFLGVLNRIGENAGLGWRSMYEGAQNAFDAAKKLDFKGMLAGYVKGWEDVGAAHERDLEITKEEIKRLEEKKKNEGEFKRISGELAALEKQRHDITINNLTAQEKVNALAQELRAARAAEAASEGDALERRKLHLAAKQAEVALVKALYSLDKEGADAKKKSDEEAIKLAEQRLKLRESEIDFQREELTAAERVAADRKDIADLEKYIAAKKKEGHDTTAEETKLLEFRKQLRKDENEAAKDALQIATLELKGIENLTAEEKIQYEILKGKTTQRKIDLEIGVLAAKGVQNLTTAEKERLATLMGQTAEIKKQVANLQEQEATVIRITTKYGKTNQQLSDRELEEKLANLKNQYAELKFNKDFNNSGWSSSNALGSYVSGQANVVQEEIMERDSFRRDYARYGEDAFSRYSAFDEERLRQYIRPEDEKRAAQTAEDIREIADRLSGRKPILGAD